MNKRYFPLFLDLSDKRVLLVGAGEVGLRKAVSVLEASPERLDVVDPALQSGIPACLSHEKVICHARSFDPSDLENKTLAFAATDNREVNAQIASLCAQKGILCNITDAPGKGDFIVPAHFMRDDICVSLCTQGQSPALARKLRRELEAWFGNRYSPLLTFLGRLRPVLLELGLPSAENGALFRSLLQSPLADYLEKHDHAAAANLLASYLPEPLHVRMGELLHDL
jgi:siroheme synthase, N-terminal domain